ncbi:glycerate kinase type-2 family protein [Limoniibacter endophyticus]|nr:glycerate kinase [Limoniibacter endophyticus]
MTPTEARHLLGDLFRTAVSAADPRHRMIQHLPSRPRNGRTVVIGAGKASAQMAAVLEDIWSGDLTGVVVTRYGYACPTKSVKILEAAHPVPDEAGISAARALKTAIADLDADDLVIALISGGGSALLPDPPEGLRLEDEIAVARSLLASGAPISAMNTIRKQLSGTKGGRLAALTKARVVSLIISDIPGDVPALVASGPTIPDTSTLADALDAIEQFKIDLPPNVLAFLKRVSPEAPYPDDPVFARNEVHLIASARQSLEAAAEMAKARGIEAVILSDAIEGEAKEVAKVHAAIAREIALRNRPFSKPVLLLSGGETTVTLDSGSDGRGGRNTEFALQFAISTQGLNIACLAADTDGIDGSEENAGAFSFGESVARLRKLGLNPRKILSRHDSFAAFEALDDLLISGPTGTNVNDFRAVLIL